MGLERGREKMWELEDGKMERKEGKRWPVSTQPQHQL